MSGDEIAIMAGTSVVSLFIARLLWKEVKRWQLAAGLVLFHGFMLGCLLLTR
jgi:hypothetical protein